jgi:hypothetical protein
MSLPPCKKPADLIGENGPRKRLNKSVIEPKWPSIRDMTGMVHCI